MSVVECAVKGVPLRRRVKGDPLIASAADLKIEGFGCFLNGVRCQGVGSMVYIDGTNQLWCRHREEYMTPDETSACTLQT